MFHIVLYQPEIPPNTGNIIRLCANTGATLHLIHPLGFSLDEKNLRRAGLDYREWVNIQEYKDFEHFIKIAAIKTIYACTTKAKIRYTHIQYQTNDAFLFGPETSGLPENILHSWPPEQKIRIPMLAHSRSLNLANSAAVILYEAWRQNNFSGARQE